MLRYIHHMLNPSRSAWYITTFKSFAIHNYMVYLMDEPNDKGFFATRFGTVKLFKFGTVHHRGQKKLSFAIRTGPRRVLVIQWQHDPIRAAFKRSRKQLPTEVVNKYFTEPVNKSLLRTMTYMVENLNK